MTERRSSRPARRVAAALAGLFSGACVAAATAPPAVPPPEAAVANRRFTGDDGAALYHVVCQGCHMPAGQGATGAGRYPALANNATLAAAPYPVLTILNGRNAMPALGGFLDDAQVAAIVNYVRTNFGNHYGDTVGAADVARFRAPPVDAPRPPSGETNMTHPKTTAAALALAGATALGASAVSAKDAIRHLSPNANAPIAQAVEVPAGQAIVFLSGAVPDVADKDAPKDSLAAYGDTRTQTISVLKKIEASLKSMNLTMGDVVKMQVFLVGDPAKGGKMDFGGMMEGYRQFFGTKEQPNLPARSVMQVAALVSAGWLVEIEVTAMRR